MLVSGFIKVENLLICLSIVGLSRRLYVLNTTSDKLRFTSLTRCVGSILSEYLIPIRDMLFCWRCQFSFETSVPFYKNMLLSL